MKIEIHIPNLDENEWEYLGIVSAQKGYKYYTGNYGSLAVWTDETESDYLFPCFRKKQNWKDKIVWPSFFKEGCWVWNVCEGKNNCCLSDRKPFYSFERKCLINGGPQHTLWRYSDFYDMSFLPDEFWNCKSEDSLVEVRHEVKE
jgi:hypothetical protein